MERNYEIGDSVHANNRAGIIVSLTVYGKLLVQFSDGSIETIDTKDLSLIEAD